MENSNKIFKENTIQTSGEIIPPNDSFVNYKSGRNLLSVVKNLMKGKTVGVIQQEIDRNEFSTSFPFDTLGRGIRIGYDDDTTQNPQLYQSSLFKPEQWESSISLDARVFHMDEKSVSCDCIIDPDENLFEKRIFPRQLFDHLFELSTGRFVVIKIRSKKGAMRIDITDGRGIVAPEKFEMEDMWESLKEF